ncbi:MAG: hypothetical protein ACRCUI_13685 [Polymorphobacter sp.]
MEPRPTRRRFPLWLTLVPLALGIGAYWLIWSSFRDRFADDIHAVLPAASTEISGFPYRLEDEIKAPVLRHDSAGWRASASADLAVLNRGPWQRDLTVLAFKAPRFAVAVPPLAGASLALSAPLGSASLRLDGNRLARLSTRFDSAAGSRATLAIGLLPVPLTADSFELHLREMVPAKTEAAAATAAAVAQFVLKGAGAKLGSGDALTLTADFNATGSALVRSYAGWAQRGTVELTALALTDATGEVLSARGSAVPQGGRLALAGTVSTVCPQMLRAAFAGTPAPPEKRLRVAVQMPVTLQGGAVTLGEPPSGWETRPVRGQLPPCPVLRR